jgi:hypothetical protein
VAAAAAAAVPDHATQAAFTIFMTLHAPKKQNHEIRKCLSTTDRE